MTSYERPGGDPLRVFGTPRHLFISLQTVKTHFNNIYRKLEVNSPPEAVAKATALGLLSFDLAELVLPMVDGKNLDFTYFAGFFLPPYSKEELDGLTDPVKPSIPAPPAPPALLITLIGSIHGTICLLRRRGSRYVSTSP